MNINKHIKTLKQCYLSHFHPHITRKNIFTVKLIVIGLAGLKILFAKIIVGAMLLAGALLNLAPMYGTANLEYVDVTKSPYGLCGNGIQEYGELCDGRISCELPCLCQENFYRCGQTCIPITLGCKSGQPISLTDPEPDPIKECENGQQRICETGQTGACAGGSQKCIDHQRTSCTPLNKSSENCTDGIDNDCDLAIDETDTDCQEIIISGCMDTNACNYNPDATQDDGNCKQPQGCNNRCPGDPGGVYKLDACNICNGDNTSCVDCAGLPNGDAIIDKCGQCLAPGDSKFNACATTNPRQLDQDNSSYTTQTVTQTKPQEIKLSLSKQQTIDFMNCTSTADFSVCKQYLTIDNHVVGLVQTVYDLFCHFDWLTDHPLCSNGENTNNTLFETSSVKKNNQKDITNKLAHEIFITCLEKMNDPVYCAEHNQATSLSQ